MKLTYGSSRSGIALMMVMICVTVLGAMAALFAYSMKVESRLAMNANAEADFYPVAQSAVDYCKAVLSAAMTCPEEPFDPQTGVWGPTMTCSNELLSLIQPTVDMGRGRKFSWKMRDLESKANINTADQMMLEQATRLLGVDAGEASTIIDSILDWIDRDDSPRISGTESDYYETLDPPYIAKNGYIDDISELLLIKGITPEMYGVSGMVPPPPPPSLREQLQMGFEEEYAQRAVLKDLFTPISSGQININTASAEVLQLVPFIDEATAQRIIYCRNGQDTGVPVPFRNPGEALTCAQVNPGVIGQITRYFTVRGRTFEAEIEVECSGVKRYYYAVLARNNQRDIQVLSFYWKQTPPKKEEMYVSTYAGTR